uniref:Uncharacterized protein n=1 Tax=viral metagenome TaxID=1070528 RepID=A0A6C0DQG5_9ZZZZ
MELNLFSITYLFLRLAPFILVCFFVFGSFFNQDFKGIIYLIGLIITGFVTILFENTGILNRFKSDESQKSPSCHAFDFTLLGFKTSNSLPMSQNIFGFTFGYLLTIISQNNIYLSNLPTLLFFPAVILFDFVWNIKNICYSWQYLFASLCIGLILGNAWAWFIKKTKNDNLLYFNFVTGNDVSCSRPSQQTFKCSMKMISNNTPAPKSK